MWRWVLAQSSIVLLVGATIDYRFLSRRYEEPIKQADCVDYSTMNNGNFIIGGLRSKRSIMKLQRTAAFHPTFPLLNTNEIYARRIDRLLPNAEDIVKEHAKLVQDINGLRQVAFVKPLVEEPRDYEDSIFHDIIEVSTTARPVPRVTTPRPPLRPTRSNSIPLILLGGASQNDLVRTQPMKFSKSVSLVGTPVSPLKHPYPFVVHGTQKPLKICMNPMHLNMYTTTHRPSLLQRLLNSILPRGR
ncbi:unnamed protein product [Diatraea saccharalis]|uniref:Uncharacterized protein n=1 Tax=Diatraea saccharalis TaxID=40085 RepID=A0A9N9N125_9NEOP|nr:unnamed protein product [Diatraea saccharalis]